MNYTRAVFLINDNVRAALCIYENEEENPKQKKITFKTFDQSLKEGDFVVVPTDTRHKMTVVKIVDFMPSLDVDVKDMTNLEWIIGKVEKADYVKITQEEDAAINAIKSAQKRKEREELKAALLADSSSTLKLLPISSHGVAPEQEVA